MKLKTLQLKRAMSVALFVLLLMSVGMKKALAQTDNITFADANVKALCIANWDTNEDGELSYAEAASVTNLGEVFSSNSTITSFDELQYFTGLTSIGSRAFNQCNGLTRITIPISVFSIGEMAFYGCSGVTSLTIPNSVTYIGHLAFSFCFGLTTVNIGNSVMMIGSRAFQNCSALTSVTFPDSMISIGEQAFHGCNGLTSILIPNSVTTIGTNPFSGCSGLEQIVVASDNAAYNSLDNCNAIIQTSTNMLVSGCKNTEIPNTVISIGDNAFFGCSGLFSMNVPGSATSIGNNAFQNCSNLTMLTMSNTLTSIGNRAFFGCNSLTSLTIDGSIITIGDRAFQNCSGLISVNIGNSVTSIGGQAFQNCSNLTTMSILADTPPTLGTNAFYGVSKSIPVTVSCGMADAYQSASGWSEFTNYVENCDNEPIVFADANVKAICVANWDTNGDGELSYAEAAAVTDLGEVFRNNRTITSFDEFQYFTGVTSIADNAFLFCNTLTSITIPNTVVSIGEHALSWCGSLAQITMPSSVSSIGAYAFTCSGLTNIIIPNSVTSIGESAFAGCANLTSIILPNSINTIGNGVFTNCSSLPSIDIPNSVTSIGNDAFNGCHALTNFTIPNTVVSIGGRAFHGCSSLNTIVIPSSVSSIGSNPFTECTGLEHIVVESDNAYYDSREGCNAIVETESNCLITGCKNTVIPSTITSIGDEAFLACRGLTSISIPNTVSSIGWHAFTACSGLSSLVIPSSVNVIGEEAFSSCSGLEIISVEQGNPNYDSRFNCNAIIKTNTNALVVGCKNTIIPQNVASIGDGAFSDCIGLVSISIPISVTSIGSFAFHKCTGLASIAIPNSVTSIGWDAFSECNALTTIKLPELITAIDGFTFSNCNNLSSILIPSSVTTIGNNAFMYCTGMASMIVQASIPPTLGYNAFGEVDKSIPVYVPAGTIDAFQSAEGWSEFTNYIDLGSPIVFVDANVKAICVANWDTNGDGELSYGEAAAVTDLGELFRENHDITSFDELQYFTGLMSIGEHAFYFCDQLESVIFPNTLVSIEFDAFAGCSKILSLFIPASVVAISNGAFSYCSKLEEIMVDSTNTYYDSRNNCNAIIKTDSNSLVAGCKTTVIPDDVTSIEIWSFFGQSDLTSIVIPDLVTEIGDYAFNSCTGLASLVIGNSVAYIGSQAFGGCFALTSIVIPRSVSSFGEGAFMFCTSLMQINVAESNSTFDSRENCNAIIETETNTLITGCKNTIIPITVSALGNHAFQGCKNLTTLTIPSSVTSIGEWCFVGCDGLNRINSLAVTPPLLGYNAFLCENCSGNISDDIPVYVPCNTLNEYVSINWGGFSNFVELCPAEITTFTNPNNGGTVYYDRLFDFENGFDDWTRIDADGDGYGWVLGANSGGIYHYTNINLAGLGHNSTDGFVCSGSYSNISNWALHPDNYLVSPQFELGGSITFYASAQDATYAAEHFGVAVSTSGNTDPNDFTTISEWTMAAKGVGAQTNVTRSGNRAQGNWYQYTVDLSAYEGQTGYVAIRHFDCYDMFCLNVDDVTISKFSSNGRTYYQDQICTLTAVPNSGYTFGSWTENGETVSTDATYSFTVGGDRTLVANFAPEGNYWTPENTGNYSMMMALTGVIEIDGVEQFSDQLEVGAFCNGVCRGSQMASEFYLTNRYLVMLSIHGEIGDELTFKLYDHGLAQELNLTSPDAVTFTIDGYGTPIEPYALNFISSYEILATTDPEGAGTIAGTGSYAAGSSCTLVAEANDGYQFVNWTLDGVEVSTNATFEFTVTQSAAYVAHFHAVQTQTLAQGWNWWSTYIGQNGNDGLTMLENSLGSNGIRIQSKNNGYVDQFEYNGTSYWYGTLNALTNEQMYMVRTNTPCDATMTGQANALADHPITINNGWNWIGFPGSESVSVANAMSGFAPEANDQIKSKNNGYSTYVVYGSNALWYGTLNTLEPGQGYMYNSNSGETKTLVYQDGRGETRANVTTEGNMFQPNEADYVHNMTITAIVELGGDELRSDSYELAAFAGNECRGSVKLMYSELLDRYIAFLLVAGEAKENLQFVLTDGRNARWSDDEMRFAIDGIVGTPIEPAIIRFGTLGVDENDGDNIIVYPNPSKNVFNVEGEGLRKVEIVNAYGQLIFTKEITDDYLQIDLSNRSAGVYMLRVVTEKGIKTQQIIKNN